MIKKFYFNMSEQMLCKQKGDALASPKFLPI